MLTEAEKWAFSFSMNRPEISVDYVEHALGLATLYADIPDQAINTLFFMGSFIGAVWGQYEGHIEQMADEYLMDTVLDKGRKRRIVLYVALAMSATHRGQQFLEKLSALDDDDVSDIRAAIELCDVAEHLDELKPTSSTHLNMLLGNFFATGRREVLEPLLRCIPKMLQTPVSGDGATTNEDFLAQSALSLLDNYKATSVSFDIALGQIFSDDPVLEQDIEQCRELVKALQTMSHNRTEG